METAKAEETIDSGNFFGAKDVHGMLNTLSIRILGMDADEFREQYLAGRLSSVPIANDLAALLPFSK